MLVDRIRLYLRVSLPLFNKHNEKEIFVVTEKQLLRGRNGGEEL